MNVMAEGEKLLARRLTGKRLSRREKKDLDFWVMWRINLELEHICAFIRNTDEAFVQYRHPEEFQRYRDYEDAREVAFKDLANAVEEEA